MKVENRNDEWLFVAETDDENNAVASLVSLLVNSNCCITEDEANNHGPGYNKNQPRNYVCIPNWDTLENYSGSDS